MEESTLHFFTTSPTAGLLKGKLIFRNGFTLNVVEVIDFAASEILDYSYTVFNRDGEIERWYDPQPHPEDPTLAVTFPHHKHEHPDIKHNRQPIEEIGFDRLNLIALINQISDMEVKKIHKG